MFTEMVSQQRESFPSPVLPHVATCKGPLQVSFCRAPAKLAQLRWPALGPVAASDFWALS